MIDTNTAFSKEYGYNVLVLVQNVGKRQLVDELWWPQFRIVGDKPNARGLLTSQGWGAEGVRRRTGIVPTLLEQPLARELYPDEESRQAMLESEPLHVFQFQLQRSQHTYAWFRVQDIAEYSKLTGKFEALGVRHGVRDWRAQSTALRMVRQE